MTPDGLVTDALIAHHVAMARAAGLTTVAYGAVDPDGRTFPAQLQVDASAAPGLRALADAVHREGSAVSLQLSHSGGFTRMRRSGGAPAGPSPGWNPYGLVTGAPRIRAMRPDEIDGVIAAFARAAKVTVEAGFDAVEVHAGHGYLLSQLLSPALNRRRDAWGGDLEGRARLTRAVVRAVRAAVGGSVAVLVKLNTRDGLPGGLELDDAVQVARCVADDSADAIVPSGGLVQRTAFYLMRGEAPWRAMADVEHHPLQRLVMR